MSTENGTHPRSRSWYCCSDDFRALEQRGRVVLSRAPQVLQEHTPWACQSTIEALLARWNKAHFTWSMADRTVVSFDRLCCNLRKIAPFIRVTAWTPPSKCWSLSKALHTTDLSERSTDAGTNMHKYAQARKKILPGRCGNDFKHAHEQKAYTQQKHVPNSADKKCR